MAHLSLTSFSLSRQTWSGWWSGQGGSLHHHLHPHPPAPATILCNWFLAPIDASLDSHYRRKNEIESTNVTSSHAHWGSPESSSPGSPEHKLYTISSSQLPPAEDWQVCSFATSWTAFVLFPANTPGKGGCQHSCVRTTGRPKQTTVSGFLSCTPCLSWDPWQ